MIKLPIFQHNAKFFYHPVLLVLTLFINLILDYANPKNDNKKSDTLFIKNQKKKLTNRLHNMTYFVTQYANIQKFIDFSKKKCTFGYKKANIEKFSKSHFYMK